MILHLSGLLALSALIAPVGDGPKLAGLEFTAPEGLHQTEARPPALWEGILAEGTREQARMILFVVPSRVGAPREERALRALEAAAVWARPFGEPQELVAQAMAAPSIHLLEIERSSGVESARLVLVQLEGRTAGILATGRPDAVTALLEPQRAAAGTIRSSNGIHPPRPGPRVTDARLGLAFHLPFGFAPDSAPPDWASRVEPPTGRLPAHFGIAADIEVAIFDALMDQPFGRAAAALRASLEDDGELLSDASANLGPLDGWRFDHQSSLGRRRLLHFVELHGRRVLISFGAPKDLFQRFEPAFTESASSFVAVDRVLPTALEPSIVDPVVGFSMRSPLGFVPVVEPNEPDEPRNDVAEFAETDRTAPRNRLTVRRLMIAPTISSDDERLAFARARADASSRTLDGAPSPILMNGRHGAAFTLNGADGLAEERWILFSRAAAHELSFEITRGEHALYRTVIDAAVLSFQPEKTAGATRLADSISAIDERVSLRPPADWEEARRAEAGVTFAQPAPGTARVEVDLGPRPDDELLQGLGDEVRAAIVETLKLSGRELVRVEDAWTETKDERTDVRLRLAWQEDGRTRRALHRAIVTDHDVVHVRFSADGASFSVFVALAELTLGSVEVTR